MEGRDDEEDEQSAAAVASPAFVGDIATIRQVIAIVSIDGDGDSQRVCLCVCPSALLNVVGSRSKLVLQRFVSLSWIVRWHHLVRVVCA